ncbi:MAG: ribulose-5-phosphate 3-epimerase [Parcubacteria group bacterium Gr01-1014_46]|nr:MAG: ribulose-5-phosphate 3-epimerase [Parcubacteria group bacterium Gr01-1014_46]
MKVLPAIIPINKSQLEEEIKKVSSFADLVQIDISDGVFTNTRTWPYNGQDRDYFEELTKQTEGWPKWEEVDIELHLMVKNPEDVLDEWISTGVSAVVCHIEATEDFQKVIDMCRAKNVSVGVAIKPNTDIEKIKDFIEQVDFIQVMGSNDLGRHGVTLDPKAIEVIKSLQKLYPESIIAIDIGVTEDTEDILISAGADKIISGGAILNSEDPRGVFEFLKSH